MNKISERVGERGRGGGSRGERDAEKGREMQRRGEHTNQRQNLKLLWVLHCASFSRVLL